MRRTFPRRWVSPASRRPRRHQKMAASREQRSGTIGFSTRALVPSRTNATRRGGEWRQWRVTASLPADTEGMFWLQVEERDSGTESDDEAERVDTGECSRVTAHSAVLTYLAVPANEPVIGSRLAISIKHIHFYLQICRSFYSYNRIERRFIVTFIYT